MPIVISRNRKYDRLNLDMTESAVMTISGDLKLIKTLDSPLEDFEPLPEGDKQRRNLSYATEAL
ncbi:MAG: hypothetical protein ACOVVP_08075, partial [Pseudanabaena sp.]